MGCDCFNIKATAVSAPLQIRATAICEREQNWAPAFDADGAELYDADDKRIWVKKVELKTK